MVDEIKELEETLAEIDAKELDRLTMENMELRRAKFVLEMEIIRLRRALQSALFTELSTKELVELHERKFHGLEFRRTPAPVPAKIQG